MRSIKVFLAFSAISCAWLLTAMDTPVTEGDFIKMIAKGQPVEGGKVLVLKNQQLFLCDEYLQRLPNGGVITIRRFSNGQFEGLERRSSEWWRTELSEDLAKKLFHTLERRFNAQEAAIMRTAQVPAGSTASGASSAASAAAALAALSLMMPGSGGK